MRHLIFFLAFIMLIPFGFHQQEAFEKSETERIEEFSHSQRIPSKEVVKSVARSIKIYLPPSDFHYHYDEFFKSYKLVQKIYLLQRNLLI
ncbi:hypothetical protein [Marivirga harenae]|uniref:hypothetical protein n=1 Tax=Marivirga harenae TaxID=2010992 RepID=UPI0026DFFF0B|nr:hypothetical protein [Marivirga harenae]WKV12326.1 hypothetical protein Q3Y49_00545 [Marivirga harenae]